MPTILTLSFSVFSCPFASSHMSCWWSSIRPVKFFFMSNMVFLSFLSPVGSSPRRVMLVFSRCMVCPIHLHFLVWMVSVMGSCRVLCHSSRSEMRSGHLKHRIWWRQVLMNTWSLWSNFLVHLQVSSLYKRTYLILRLNSLSFMRLLRFLLLQTDLRVAKAWCTLLILALVSLSVTPVLLTMLPM